MKRDDPVRVVLVAHYRAEGGAIVEADATGEVAMCVLMAGIGNVFLEDRHVQQPVAEVDP